MTPARKPPHVAYLITHYPSPSHTFIYGEIRGLQELGVQVSPISVNPVGPNELLSEQDRREAARTYYVKSLPGVQIVWAVLLTLVRRPQAMLRTVRLAFHLGGWDFHAVLWHLFHVVEAILVLRHCKSVGATHLHSHFGGLPSTIALYASELSIVHGERTLPWSVTVHGFHEFTNERNSLLLEKIQQARFVICISDFTRSQLLRIVGDPEKWPDIHVIRCGIDLDHFHYSPRELSSPFRVMVTARIVAEKGIGVLLDAIGELHRRGLPVELVVVGDGPDRAVLAARADTIGLGEHVQWLGMQPPTEVLRYLQASDVFCLPSFGEGLPIVLMEAMAVGVPVVSTYLGGIPELVINGVTGRLVPAGRADLLADALAALGGPSPERDAMIKAARERVEELHETHRSARMVRDLLCGDNA